MKILLHELQASVQPAGDEAVALEETEEEDEVCGSILWTFVPLGPNSTVCRTMSGQTKTSLTASRTRSIAFCLVGTVRISTLADSRELSVVAYVTRFR
jgi:hypothetical protein